jgi:UDP-N-acetylglucosamine transferase subunit ALG13
MKILVLCGTHTQPFDRLVDAAAALAAAGHHVTVQRGVSTRPCPGGVVLDVIGPDALGALADAAELIVGHAAPGTAFLAWERGLRPVLVPRSAAHHEHVDDHQARFAQAVQGRAVVVLDPAQVAPQIAAMGGRAPTVAPSEAGVSEAFLREFAALADNVVAKARQGVRKRARVRDVLQALGRRAR